MPWAQGDADVRKRQVRNLTNHRWALTSSASSHEVSRSQIMHLGGALVPAWSHINQAQGRNRRAPPPPITLPRENPF